ncbi:MAG: glycerophosphodiester phosphodiesterase [Chlamydiales bacterium]|nr:glycerophosphodiester phosphodiesterase [Chlamydiales bacterium]
MKVSTQAWIIAHRGASKEVKENTLGAFRRAIERGAHCLEVDVHLTKDGIPICRHDFAVGPDCKLVSELTVKELKERAEGTPTLEQLLSVNRGSVELFVELKSEGCRDPSQLVRAVTELLAFYGGFGNTQPFAGSFSASILRELVGVWPHDKMVGIVEYASEIDPLLAHRPAILAMEAALATPQRVQNLQQQGIKVWCWTVDDEVKARQLLDCGVQGIITNDPHKLLSVI